MDDLPYTKREQDKYRTDVIETLSRIEAQTTKTNGRVTRLERTITIVITALTVWASFQAPELISIISGV